MNNSRKREKLQEYLEEKLVGKKGSERKKVIDWFFDLDDEAKRAIVQNRDDPYEGRPR